ncbi:MAG: hypothetical protein M1821_006295 [Bathelium mastoideum]|nr:MAG: hypothetical protein M1821_006295 [Bathelium mastoideum]
MASNNKSTSQGEDADLAQAFKDIAKGEQQASAIENNLTSLEKKIDELLERAHEDQRTLESLADYSKGKSQRNQRDTSSGEAAPSGSTEK